MNHPIGIPLHHLLLAATLFNTQGCIAGRDIQGELNVNLNHFTLASELHNAKLSPEYLLTPSELPLPYARRAERILPNLYHVNSIAKLYAEHQRTSNDCWAATIKSVLTMLGLRVGYEDITKQGSSLLQAGGKLDLGGILQILRLYKVDTWAITNSTELIMFLAQNSPILLALTDRDFSNGHVYWVTSASFGVLSTSIADNATHPEFFLHSVYVFDPAGQPGPQSWMHFGLTTFLQKRAYFVEAHR